MGKQDFIMPFKYRNRFERWDAEKCKAILMAMFDYAERGRINLPPTYMDSFEAIMDDMDIVKKAYEEKCRVNAENGAKGGKAKQANATERKRTGANLADKIREDKIREDKIRKNKYRSKGEDDLPFYPLSELIK